jgi:hypothetical protein
MGLGSTTSGKGSSSTSMGTGGSSAGTTGLNNADEHAGKHGAKGRENAREHQK